MANQFDPVAAAAMGALDATESGLRRLQSQTNAPQLPAQQTVSNGVRQAIRGVAQFSPFNILARGGNLPSSLPSPPRLPFSSGSAFEPPAFRDASTTSGDGGGGGSGGSGSAFE